MLRQLAFLVLFLPLAACGSDRQEGPAPDPNLLIANDFAVSLGGERLAGPPADAWTKIEPLAAKLTERRAKWREQHPNETEAEGELTLDLGPTLTCRAAMSVFMTAAQSGHGNITLKQGPVSLKLPYTPSPEDVGPDRCLVPVPTLATRFFANGDVDLALRPCGGIFDVMPAAQLGSMVNDFCKRSEGCFDVVRISCDAEVPMSTVLRALADVQKAYPKMAIGIGYPCEGEAPSPFYPRMVSLPAPSASNAASASPAPSSAATAKKGAPPNVTVDTITVTGALTPTEVEEALRPLLPEIRACYETGLTETPDLKGRVVTKLLVGRKGAVMQITRGESELDRGGMTESCVMRAFYRGVTFPAKGAISWVTYPVLLSP